MIEEDIQFINESYNIINEGWKLPSLRRFKPNIKNKELTDDELIIRNRIIKHIDKKLNNQKNLNKKDYTVDNDNKISVDINKKIKVDDNDINIDDILQLGGEYNLGKKFNKFIDSEDLNNVASTNMNIGYHINNIKNKNNISDNIDDISRKLGANHIYNLLGYNRNRRNTINNIQDINRSNYINNLEPKAIQDIYDKNSTINSLDRIKHGAHMFGGVVKDVTIPSGEVFLSAYALSNAKSYVLNNLMKWGKNGRNIIGEHRIQHDINKELNDLKFRRNNYTDKEYIEEVGKQLNRYVDELGMEKAPYDVKDFL